jgi:hypothetical protein
MAVYLPFIVLLLAMVLRSLGQILQALRGAGQDDSQASAP